MSVRENTGEEVRANRIWEECFLSKGVRIQSVDTPASQCMQLRAE